MPAQSGPAPGGPQGGWRKDFQIKHGEFTKTFLKVQKFSFESWFVLHFVSFFGRLIKSNVFCLGPPLPHPGAGGRGPPMQQGRPGAYPPRY